MFFFVFSIFPARSLARSLACRLALLRVSIVASSISSSKTLAVKFHIAHLYEIQGKASIARTKYELLIECKDLSIGLRSDCLRQLGWLYHTNESFGDAHTRLLKASSLLKAAINVNPESSHAYYSFGRIYSSTNRVQDAFVSYRNAVERSEAKSDTWCSIGVLYQKQNQFLDAQQAYVCSTQLERESIAAWNNLGTLYENFHQFHDAYRCYVHAINCKDSDKVPALFERVNYFRSQLANLNKLAASPHITPNKLSALEEIWNYSLTSDMASRQNSNFRQQISNNNSSNNNNNGGHNSTTAVTTMPPNEDQQHHQHHHASKRFKNGGSGAGGGGTAAVDSFNRGSLSPTIKSFFVPNGAKGGLSPLSMLLPPIHVLKPPMMLNASRTCRDSVDSDGNSNITMSSDESVAAFGNENNNNKETYSSQNSNIAGVPQPQQHHHQHPHHHSTNASRDEVMALLNSAYFKLNHAAASSSQQQQQQPAPPPLTTSNNNNNQAPQQPKLSIELTGDEIVKECQRCPWDAKIVSSIVSDDGELPRPPEPPYPPLSKEKLNPPTPSVYVSTLSFGVVSKY